MNATSYRKKSGMIRGLESEQSSTTRYKVVTLTVLLAVITYMDRVCMATLAPRFMEEFRLTNMQMSYVFSAFSLAYMLFEIPTAAWADKVGTRKVLTRIVLWWSCFTIATAAAFNFVTLVGIRFLFGAGEAGAWPTVARSYSQWIPYRERGTVQGVFFVGAHIGGGLTPLLVAVLTDWLPWRSVFVVFGMIGFFWAVYWHLWFRDDPADHPQVNTIELRVIQTGRRTEAAHVKGFEYWLVLLRNRNVWALCLMYLPNTFGFYFCISWLPRYLSEEHGFDGIQLAIFTGLPLVLSVFADVSGGLVTDWAVARFGARLGRAGIGFGAYVVGGIAMLLAAATSNPAVAGTLIALATAASMFMLGSAWATCQDIGGKHTGVVSAAMNTAGQLGGFASPILVMLLVEKLEDWNSAIVMIGAFFFFGALCWCFIDPDRMVFEEFESNGPPGPRSTNRGLHSPG